MVVKAVKFLFYILFFCVALYYFFPKVNAYYAFEKSLEKENIIISNENLIDHGFSLEIKDAIIFYHAIKVADVKKISLYSYLFVSKIDIKDIVLQKMADGYIPPKIESCEISYSLLSPLELKAQAQGDFGKATIFYSLKTKKLLVLLEPSKVMLHTYAKTLAQMKKEKGKYKYETVINF